MFIVINIHSEYHYISLQVLKGTRSVNVFYCKSCLEGRLEGLELRVARLDDLSVDAAPGEPGELLVRGPMVIQDYYQAL